MAERLGYGDYQYELVRDWAKIPPYFTWQYLQNTPWDVACDSEDRVFLFGHGNHPLIILDREGNFITCWGEGHFINPHDIYISGDNSVFLIDRQTHSVEKYTPEGELLFTMGDGWAKPVHHGAPFNMPSGTTVAPSGEIFVSDGYGNRRVHKFSADGELIKSWGKEGEGPGEFVIPHNIDVDKDGLVYVCDRQNDRIQVFTPEGEFVKMWTDYKKPCDIYIDRENDIFYVCEGWPWLETPRVSVHAMDGNVLSDWSGRASRGEGVMENAHGIWVDSHGDIYIADVEPGGLNILKFAKV